MVRDHRPYALNDLKTLTFGVPYGWDPCYLHEFRSVPYYTLEFDEWYSTDFPGTVSYSDSTEEEEIFDGYEEVEIYTKNPELFESDTTYSVSIRYSVWYTGNVVVTLEAELGNEDDLMASLSPPAYPVAGIEVEDETVSHSQKSYRIYPMSAFSSAGLTSDTSTSTWLNSNNTTLIPISWVEHHQWYDISVVGKYPEYLKVFTRLNIENRSDLEGFVDEKNMELSTNSEKIDEEFRIPTTITFNHIVSVNDVLNFVKQHDLEVARFRFTGQNSTGNIIRGQGKPQGGEIIPVDVLNDFIAGYKLLGIQSIDVVLNSSVFESLALNDMIAVIDFAAFLATVNAGINVNEFHEVHWYTEDPSWFINHT